MAIPDTEMRVAAVAMHEMFTSLVGAGFTRREALTIVTDILKAVAIEGINSATASQD